MAKEFYCFGSMCRLVSDLKRHFVSQKPNFTLKQTVMPLPNDLFSSIGIVTKELSLVVSSNPGSKLKTFKAGGDAKHVTVVTITTQKSSK